MDEEDEEEAPSEFATERDEAGKNTNHIKFVEMQDRVKFKVVVWELAPFFMPIFRNVFFFFWEKKNCFEFLICYYSHLIDTERKILKKFNNLLLLLWLFEVGASKKKRVGGPGDFDS